MLFDVVIGWIYVFRYGGIFVVFLVCDVLVYGYLVMIYIYNFMVFDLIWFCQWMDIVECLCVQCELKYDWCLYYVIEGYLEFLCLGGYLCFIDLLLLLVCGLFCCCCLIIIGLSLIFFYWMVWEYGLVDIFDDLCGIFFGYFVVIVGYDWLVYKFLVVDFYGLYLYGMVCDYWICMDCVFNVVLFGIVIYDVNLFIVVL